MRCIVVVLLTLVCTATAVGSEFIVQTDSLPPASSHRINEVSAGERFANLLTAPVDGQIVGVQILWGSIGGGGAPSQEAAIRISSFANNDFYKPASTLATITSPVLEDGIVNEFRYVDPGTNSIPLSIPITAGTKFFVDLEIANGHGYAGPGVIPCLLLDANGTQGTNSAWINGNWVPFSIAFSGGGDFGIRAIIATVPEPSTYVLAVIGLAALAFSRRTRSR